MDESKLRRVVLYIIPVLTLAAVVLFLNGGQYLKKPVEDTNDFPRCLQLLKEDINNEDWEAAGSDLDKLQASWNRVLTRIQYGVNRNEVHQINIRISRIRGAIQARDKTAALIEINELENHWNALGTQAMTKNNPVISFVDTSKVNPRSRLNTTCFLAVCPLIKRQIAVPL
jgi:hypothetical protein